MSFLGVYNSTRGFRYLSRGLLIPLESQILFLGVYNSTGGIWTSFQGVYNSTGGLQKSFLGLIIPLKEFRYSFYGFIIPLEGFRYPFLTSESFLTNVGTLLFNVTNFRERI